MELQKEKLENTNERTQQGGSFNKEAGDNSMSNQLNLGQLLQLLDAGTPLAKDFLIFKSQSWIQLLREAKTNLCAIPKITPIYPITTRTGKAKKSNSY